VTATSGSLPVGASAERDRSFLALGAMGVAVVSWGIGGPLGKAVSVSSTTISFWRFWMVSFVLLVWCRVMRIRLRWQSFRTALAGGVLFAVQIALFFAAVKTTTIANAQIIGSLQPAIVLLVAARLFGEHIRKQDLLWALVAFAAVGAFVVAGAGAPAASGRGDLYAIGNVLVWTGYFLEIKRARNTGVGAIEYMAAVMVVAAVLFTPFALVVSDDLTSPRGVDWLWLVGLVVFPGIGGHTVMTWATKYIDVSLSSVLTLGVPVVSAIGAWWVHDEALDAGQIAAGAVVLFALGAVVWGQRVRSRLEPGEKRS